jgi:hypothetical protein
MYAFCSIRQGLNNPLIYLYILTQVPALFLLVEAAPVQSADERGRPCVKQAPDRFRPTPESTVTEDDRAQNDGGKFRPFLTWSDFLFGSNLAAACAQLLAIAAVLAVIYAGARTFAP